MVAVAERSAITRTCIVGTLLAVACGGSVSSGAPGDAGDDADGDAGADTSEERATPPDWTALSIFAGKPGGRGNFDAHLSPAWIALAGGDLFVSDSEENVLLRLH
jgi:hypothetical protein